MVEAVLILLKLFYAQSFKDGIIKFDLFMELLCLFLSEIIELDQMPTIAALNSYSFLMNIQIR